MLIAPWIRSIQEDAVENPALSGGGYVGGLEVLRSKGLDAVTRTLEYLLVAQTPAGR